MGEKIIRQATCDRCGKKCFDKTNNHHYTKILFSTYDSRLHNQPKADSGFVLCGDCLSKFSDWLNCVQYEEPPKVAEKECNYPLYTVGHILVEGYGITEGENPNTLYGGIWQKGKRMFVDANDKYVMRNFWTRIE